MNVWSVCFIQSLVIYLDEGVWSCWETIPRLGIFLLNLAIHCFCSFSLVHITSNSFTDSLSLTGRRETKVETCSSTSADRFTSAWLHEFLSIVVMLFMTTNMTSSTFETWRRREDIVTRTITCFTLSGHTIGNNNETMTLVFNGLSTMSILILGRQHQCRDRQRGVTSSYLRLNHGIRHRCCRIIEQYLTFTIVQNLKDFRDHIRIHAQNVTWTNM